MKKKYQLPELTVKKLSAADVITMSGGDGYTDDPWADGFEEDGGAL